MALLDVKGLSFTYPQASEPALRDIDLQIARGELITVMGPTGSGKSTLLRLIKPELRQNGDISGQMLYQGRDISALSARSSAEKIGYVAQNPDEQIVTDKVWHELAFTLESLGAGRELISRRIAEIAAFFDIGSWLGRDTSTLSGGQKQLLNLASVMISDPELLVLDEPTAQLDPIAASRFIDVLRRLNSELGLTVIISEHRAEELLPISDRLIMLDKGKIAFCDTPRKAASALAKSGFISFLPAASKIFSAMEGKGEAPLSVREGQAFLSTLSTESISYHTDTSEKEKGEEALSLSKIFFRYERKGADILGDLDLSVTRGEILAVLGANGAGKSTMAAVAAGLRRPYSGTVKLFGKKLSEYKNGELYQGNISLLPQDTESIFIRETVREELKGCDEIIKELPFDLSPLFDRHPYDISGGERQLVALCKALSTRPRLIILDEPSKGLDNNTKALLIKVIRELKERGVTVLLISHDVEFAALCADRCALFAQGRIAAVGDTEQFMRENRFYTTSASRITRSFFDGGYTVERAVSLLKGGGAE